jgi:hypothetical protein
MKFEISYGTIIQLVSNGSCAAGYLSSGGSDTSREIGVKLEEAVKQLLHEIQVAESEGR